MRDEESRRLMFEGRDLGAELKETWRITRLSAWRAVVEFYEADDLTYAASIAYYALLSLFPFALITVSILGSVTSDDATRQKVLLFVAALLPGAIRLHHLRSSTPSARIRSGSASAAASCSCGARSVCSARSARR